MTDKTVLKQIGKRISERRKELKLTQEKIAEKMDVSVQMISNLELGKKAIRPENLIKLCEVLEVSSDYILMGKTTYKDKINMLQKLNQLSETDYKMILLLIEFCLNKNGMD